MSRRFVHQLVHQLVRQLAVWIALLGWAEASWAQPALDPSGSAAVGSPEPGAPETGRTAPGVPETGRAAPARVAPATSSESAASSPPAIPRPALIEPSFRWKPFGYLRVQAAVVQNDPNVAFVGRADGFELQNARLGVSGELGARAAFEVSFDGAVDEREKVNVPNGRLRVGLREARADLRLTSTLTMRVGRFEIWFDPDGRDGDTARSFVDRALESRGVRATEGWETQGLPPGRSLGMALRWRVGTAAADPGPGSSAVDLEVAAQNGADEFATNNDNDSPALSAAVRVVSPVLGWAQLAGRWNQRTEGELPFRQDETDLEGALALGATLGPVVLSAGGVLVRTAFATTGGAGQRAWGAHGQVRVRLPIRVAALDVGYRFAILDPSSLVLTDRLMEHTGGLVVGLPAMHARLQFNITHAVEQAARELSNDRFEVVVEVTL
jgi:Phosphate-selective porin O and P